VHTLTRTRDLLCRSQVFCHHATSLEDINIESSFIKTHNILNIKYYVKKHQPTLLILIIKVFSHLASHCCICTSCWLHLSYLFVTSTFFRVKDGLLFLKKNLVRYIKNDPRVVCGWENSERGTDPFSRIIYYYFNTTEKKERMHLPHLIWKEPMENL
jgi:hypothetical protein